ncbi:MAG: hypothetical protein IKD86_02410 [Firmicutes bacterium]|nr:hypothetical protein [Bacillota bacterium]
MTQGSDDTCIRQPGCSRIIPTDAWADDRIIDERAARYQIIDISSDHQIR